MDSPIPAFFLSTDVIGTWLIAANAIAFLAFGLDKYSAVTGRRRTSEATLLTWAMVGGTPGAYAARALFRHKTRKQPFSNTLHTIAILQVAALAGLAVFLLP